MTETLFAFDELNYLECQEGYRGEKNQEYYLGDYNIEAGSTIDVRADRKAVGSCSIIRLCSRTRLQFNRSWSHIREDATDVMVLWFVQRGRLRISHHGESSVAEAGDFAVTNSMKPFSMECQMDGDSVHEVLHVIVPAHQFRRFIAHEVKPFFVIEGSARQFRIAHDILTGVFEDKGELSQRSEQLLVDSALALLLEAVTAREDCMLVRQSLREQRLQEVLKYIDVHLSDPNLSAVSVAGACGISSRYLSTLLGENGTPFSELVWDKRVKIASSWLSNSRPSDISIAEIAFRVGFKSPAHFSRMFKRVLKQGPREFRNACLEKQDSAMRYQRDIPPAYLAGGSNTVQ